jgi:hypothetical protein
MTRGSRGSSRSASESEEVGGTSARGIRGSSRFIARLLGVAGACLLHAPVAHAQASQDDVAAIKAVCLRAHEQAQETRKASKFSEARKLLRACAQDACPGLIRADCVPWLADLDGIYPSVVFDAYVDGRQVQAAHAYIDGRLATDRIDGKPIELDPGEHAFRIEVSDFPPNEQTVVILERSDPRVVSASFQHPKPVVRPPQYRPVPASVWVAGGIAVAGVVSLAVFGSLALEQRGSLQGSCSPVCTDSQLGSLNVDMRGADVSLGIAAAAAITGGVLFLLRPEVERRPHAPSFSVTPTAGAGGILSLQSSF